MSQSIEGAQEVARCCELCGEPMPEGEEMFQYHGYSGPCSKPPLPARDAAQGERAPWGWAVRDAESRRYNLNTWLAFEREGDVIPAFDPRGEVVPLYAASPSGERAPDGWLWRMLVANGNWGPWHFSAVEKVADRYMQVEAIYFGSEPPAQGVGGAEAFQSRVEPWLLECFGAEIANDRSERCHRFIEEVLELVQALGCTASEAHQLVDYVYERPVGEPHQEAGGTMVTLAALCRAAGLDMHEAGEAELARVWTKVEKIRAKQAAKPKHSPLPALRAAPVEAAPWRDGGVDCFDGHEWERVIEDADGDLVATIPTDCFTHVEASANERAKAIATRIIGRAAPVEAETDQGLS